MHIGKKQSSRDDRTEGAPWLPTVRLPIQLQHHPYQSSQNGQYTVALDVYIFGAPV